MKRDLRLKALKQIINDKKISSQEVLIEELKKRGFNVTQATVSRDIQFLNIVKVRDAENNEYYAFNTGYKDKQQFDIKKLKLKFKENVLAVLNSANIIVIKTNPGEAQGVAVVIDGCNFKEILGTVAGDDTIICVAENEESSKKIADLFKSF